jgi:uncharacterized protein (TIGR02145 family)
MKKGYFSYLFFLVVLMALLACCTKSERPPDPVADINGNVYKTVKIGEQIIMAENLRTTKFNDGTEIPLIESSKEWGKLTSPGACWYNEEEDSTRKIFGALYNGYTLDSGKLCPVGWHIPTLEDFNTLREFLGDTLKAGGMLKDRGTDHWLVPNKGADNSTGFSADGSGIRYFEGSFTARSSYTAFWSSTSNGNNNLWYLSLYYGDGVVRMGNISKKHGFSVRCIKD